MRTAVVILMATVMVLTTRPAEAKRGGGVLGALGAAVARGAGRGLAQLSYQELLLCMRLERQIESASERIEEQRARIAESRLKLKNMGAKLDRLDLIDTAEGVEEYNAMVPVYNGLIDLIDTEIVKLNLGVDRINASIDNYNARCADKSYYEDDHERALREMQ